MSEKKTRFDRVNEQRDAIVKAVVERMAEEGINWTKSWSCPTLPFNPVSGTRYSGINQFNLALIGMVRGIEDPRWMTFKQAKALGYRVRKGAKSAAVEKWSPVQIAPKGKDGKVIKDCPDDEKRFAYRCLGYFTVFNAAEIEGIKPFEVEFLTGEARDAELEETIDRLESSSRCEVKEELTDRACYIPSMDMISMPLRDSFASRTAFTQVLLHEMGHSTGHQSCLGRDIRNRFGSEGYAREELVAELTAMFCSAELGIEPGHTPGNEHFDRHAAYLQGWIKAIEDDPEALFGAAKAATRAADAVIERFVSSGGVLPASSAVAEAKEVAA